MDFEIVGEISEIENIATGASIPGTEMSEKSESVEKEGFALCLDNQGYPASLQLGKVYRFLEDKGASSHGYIRIIDESGEDYAYSKDRFFYLQLPEAVQKALSSFPKQHDA